MQILGAPLPSVLTLGESWRNFPMLRLRFYLKSEGMSFPAFHGAFWHSVIGMGLHRRFPKTYECLWEGAGSRLYAIFAPMRLKSRIVEGEILSFDLTLFGEGTRHAISCMETLHEISLSGLGSKTLSGERGTARLLSVESVTPSGVLPVFGAEKGSVSIPSPFFAGEILSLVKGVSTRQVNLLCDTPLHLKEENRVCMGSPAFSLIVKRVLGRMNQFIPMPFTMEKKLLVEKSLEVSGGEHDVRWWDLHRWSSRQEKDLIHGGIVGNLAYQGEMTPFLPWLALGQWLQIGSKTTFGFGVYRLGVESSGGFS